MGLTRSIYTCRAASPLSKHSGRHDGQWWKALWGERNAVVEGVYGVEGGTWRSEEGAFVASSFDAKSAARPRKVGAWANPASSQHVH